MLHQLISSITESELRFIAELDYGIDADLHLAELRSVLTVQNGQLQEGQYWHPYEVIELGSHSLKEGHEREFVVCTLLVIGAVTSGYDTSTNLNWKLNDRAQDYDALPTHLREAIISSYLSAGC